MTVGRCPTSYELGAVLRVATVLPPVGITSAQARASYKLIPAGGLYRLEDFLSAETLLRRCNFVEVRQDVLTPRPELLYVASLPENEAMEVLLLAIVERDPPVWALAVGDRLTGLPVENIPDDDWVTFKSIVTDAARREEFLLALGRRFDAEELAALGAGGEEFVAGECRIALMRHGRPDLAERVQRVSLISDQLGYDIVAPAISRETWHIEVKTTRLLGGLARVTLTRNEVRIGLSDQCWALVLCLRRADDHFEIGGWCKAHALADLLPVDPSERGAWMSASIILDERVLRSGMPDLVNGPGG